MRFRSTLVVESISRNQWRVFNDFAWSELPKSNPDYWNIVPRGFKTDFASIPPFAKFLVDDDDYCEASLIHDYLYRMQRPDYPRKRADRIFLAALKATGCDWFRRWIMYGFVRSFGWLAWKGNQKRGTGIALLALMFAGCANTTFYDRKTGKPLCKTSGDVTDLRILANGDIAVAKIDHSTATLAQGKAASDKIAASGAAIMASGIMGIFH